MISHKHKLIFIHIPKCAGTSMEAFLKDNAEALGPEKEEGLKYAIRKTGLAKTINSYSDYFLFAFIRNPFDRFVSIWKHSIREYSSDKSSYFYREERDLTLKEYAYLIREDSTKKLSKFDRYHSLCQVDFIPDFNKSMFGEKIIGDRKCDFIGRFENLEDDFKRLCYSLELSVYKLPRERISPEKESVLPTKHYGDYYDLETLKIVEDIYSKDLRLLGYSYEAINLAEKLSLKETINLCYRMMIGDFRRNARKFKRQIYAIKRRRYGI